MILSTFFQLENILKNLILSKLFAHWKLLLCSRIRKSVFSGRYIPFICLYLFVCVPDHVFVCI